MSITMADVHENNLRGFQRDGSAWTRPARDKQAARGELLRTVSGVGASLES
jgi:hypothetical protein